MTACSASSAGRFQSTHPVRGGTGVEHPAQLHSVISIHPPRAGWDGQCLHTVGLIGISIHPPRAGWDVFILHSNAEFGISIHPPRAGWDHSAVAQDLVCGISIHPPRAGWDLQRQA